MTTVREQIYTILYGYLNTAKPQSVGGGYVEDSRVTSDLQRVSSIDEDIPVGQFYRGIQDTTIAEYLPTLSNYTKYSSTELLTVVNQYYKSKDAYAKVPKSAYGVFETLNNIIQDILQEPHVVAVLGWENTQ